MTEDNKTKVRAIVRKHIDEAVEELLNENVDLGYWGENVEHYMSECASCVLFGQAEACCSLMRDDPNYKRK